MTESLFAHIEKGIRLDYAAYTHKKLAIMAFANVSEATHNAFHQLIFDKACIHLHFHPDRYIAENVTILDGLLETGVYKNQYETQVSSGSLTAKIGGERDNWENRLFQQYFGTNTHDRPKYGALNLTASCEGASPRFGACFLVTHPHVTRRSTFTYGDSYLLPNALGTAQYFDTIYSQLYEDIFTRNFALGFQYAHLQDFIQKTTDSLRATQCIHPPVHNLDFYIEAQMHGEISLTKDIACLVADYSFKGTEFEDSFHQLCEKYQLDFVWNPGYELEANQFPDYFRGPEIPEIAERMAENGKVNAYLIGKFLQHQSKKPTHDKHALFQLSKYVWHCLVKFGKPIQVDE